MPGNLNHKTNKVTTIIKPKKIFWSNLQKILVFLFFVLILNSCHRKEVLKTASFKTESGWGYTIAYKNKIIIKQSIIPVISDTKSFATEEDALKTADLVKQKIKKNTSPTVTKKDLILLKIKF
ncbi:DUF4907 domain-containing protein [Flavobacterium sp. KB82]|uniref:DUF4907 domain-containing protein n=1 Tax=Flavobacterium hungaricum TaxID=2082725 RepID=A0ABR9TJV2_9FLAO|nr:DUF4907 domain-containing protein [Flavobacterium hungaricum]MBE8725556.1 DUF4907 domain-containing protein [Flavobacterium hungaricum]